MSHDRYGLYRMCNHGGIEMRIPSTMRLFAINIVCTIMFVHDKHNECILSGYCFHHVCNVDANVDIDATMIAVRKSIKQEPKTFNAMQGI